MTFVPDPDTSAAQWGVLAGRLRDSATSPRTDPRTHSRIEAALTPLGLDALNPDPEITRSSSAAERAKAVAEGHKGFEEMYAALPNELPGDDSIDVTQETTAVDGLAATRSSCTSPARTAPPDRSPA